jgi:DNA (cytosine-5)-methyltransferase 1
MYNEFDRPLAIDLFSGAGGMSLGFEQAGFDVAAAVELDPVHASVHKFNFPLCAVLPRSVVGLSGAEIRASAGIGDAPIGVVFGGAPCQGFSMMGYRALDDPRNSLVKEFVRIVTELAPSYFVFENVKGLTLGRHEQFLREVVEAFDGAGYQVVLPWRVLNAACFGVPQHRERLFLLGARRGLPAATYPDEVTSVPGSLLGLPEAPTCRCALDDLPNAESYRELLSDDEILVNDWQPRSEHGVEMHCTNAGSWHFGYRREWLPNLLTSSLRTEHTSISRRRFAETLPGEVEPISRFYRLPPDGLSNTLRAGTDSSRGAFTSPRPIHYRYPRCITVREMARLSGFPDWFRLHKTKWHGARQIGNAVPPPLARAVAKEIMKCLAFEPRQPSSTLELGETSLLAMDMSAASEYWGVDVPVGKRDRKNGLKKRKQEYIESLREKGAEVRG